MTDLIKRKFKAFRVGPLPAGAINRALGTELDSADVWVSKACHQHIAYDHPDDYHLVIANIIDIIRSPTWVGQDAPHGSNFYLVKRIPTGTDPEIVLVAIGLQISGRGTYNVKSAYAISQEDVDSRRFRGSLKALMFV